jgi:hypothetical protein
VRNGERNLPKEWGAAMSHFVSAMGKMEKKAEAEG